jgi:DNA-binding Lrp family transcriptional regulator
LTAEAFLLINVDIGTQTQVVKELKSIQKVKEVHLTSGVYDIIAKVEAATQEELKKVITYEIRVLRNVRSTLSMIVVAE